MLFSLCFRSTRKAIQDLVGKPFEHGKQVMEVSVSICGNEKTPNRRYKQLQLITNAVALTTKTLPDEFAIFGEKWQSLDESELETASEELEGMLNQMMEELRSRKDGVGRETMKDDEVEDEVKLDWELEDLLRCERQVWSGISQVNVEEAEDEEDVLRLEFGEKVGAKAAKRKREVELDGEEGGEKHKKVEDSKESM